jgi:hypothetical protein
LKLIYVGKEMTIVRRIVIALLLAVSLGLIFAVPALANGKPGVGLLTPPGPPLRTPPEELNQAPGIDNARDVIIRVGLDTPANPKGYPQ